MDYERGKMKYAKIHQDNRGRYAVTTKSAEPTPKEFKYRTYDEALADAELLNARLARLMK